MFFLLFGCSGIIVKYGDVAYHRRANIIQGILNPGKYMPVSYDSTYTGALRTSNGATVCYR